MTGYEKIFYHQFYKDYGTKYKRKTVGIVGWILDFTALGYMFLGDIRSSAVLLFFFVIYLLIRQYIQH